MKARAAALIAVAIVLVATVLGVQVANGGGDFVPAERASPCTHPRVSTVSSGIEGLGERLVLLGLDAAACRLGVTREALTLELAQTRSPTDAQLRALHAGLLDAVERMKKNGTLPPISDFTDEALDNSDLNFFVKAAIRALPDSLIDAALKTDDVLRRTIDDLDLRSLFANLDDSSELTKQIDAAVTGAVKDALIARLRDLL